MFPLMATLSCLHIRVRSAGDRGSLVFVGGSVGLVFESFEI